MDLIKDLCSKIKLFCNLEMAIVDKLEQMEKELYAVKEDNKRIVAVNRSLETRYSELLLAFSQLRKDVR